MVPAFVFPVPPKVVNSVSASALAPVCLNDPGVSQKIFDSSLSSCHPQPTSQSRKLPRHWKASPLLFSCPSHLNNFVARSSRIHMSSSHGSDPNSEEVWERLFPPTEDGESSPVLPVGDLRSSSTLDSAFEQVYPPLNQSVELHEQSNVSEGLPEEKRRDDMLSMIQIESDDGKNSAAPNALDATGTDASSSVRKLKAVLGGTARDPATSRTGFEPVLGGRLAQRAVFVNQVRCIGCTQCAVIARGTFLMEPMYGRARVFSQSGDVDDVVQEAVDACPVAAIKRVSFSELPALVAAREQMIMTPAARAEALAHEEWLERQQRNRKRAEAVTRAISNGLAQLKNALLGAGPS